MAKPLVPWIGGKRKLAAHILPLFPEHQCYVEPFVGAGALFFMKDPSRSEVLNDINGDLVNLYRVVKQHTEELHKQFKWVLISRQHWLDLQATPVHVLTDIQRAARFLYLQKLAFGGKVDGQTFGTDATSRPRFNMFSLEQDLADAHYRLSSATIEHLSWESVVEKYDRPGTLFYCDPPYWQTEGYGVDFEWSHYVRLRDVAESMAGTLILSINDHPDIRALFADMPLVEVDYAYTAGGGSGTACTELIYGNWPGGVPKKQQEQAEFF